MTKEPNRSIYNCLGGNFWTKRQCSQCQKNFTILDWKQQNYQLFFKEIGQVKSTASLNCAVLEGVIVELQHLLCPLTGGWNYQKDIIGND